MERGAYTKTRGRRKTAHRTNISTLAAFGCAPVPWRRSRRMSAMFFARHPPSPPPIEQMRANSNWAQHSACVAAATRRRRRSQAAERRERPRAMTTERAAQTARSVHPRRPRRHPAQLPSSSSVARCSRTLERWQK